MKKVIVSIIVIGLLLSTTPLSIGGKEEGIEPSFAVGNLGIVTYNFNDNFIELPMSIPGEFIVKFKDNVDVCLSSSNGVLTTGVDTVDELNQEFGVTSAEKLLEDDVIPSLSKTYMFMLADNIDTEFLVENYSNDFSVEFAEPNYLGELYDVPNDPYFDMQWALHNTGQNGGTSDADIDAPEAWDVETGDDDVVIAVLDSGVDYNHPDLSANILRKNGNIVGKDFADGDDDPLDDFGHGTHCAGIAAAVTNNGVGVAGIARGCKIMPIRTFGDLIAPTEGIAKAIVTSWVVQSIVYAVIHDANVISMSFGLFFPSEIIDRALIWADYNGVVLVAAAGNEYTTSLSLPASHDKVIAVAATDNTDAKVGFSNYGSFVDVGAPGVNIYSTMPTYDVDLTEEYGFSKNYDYMSGTSMSCPLVAGVAALVLSHNPNLTPMEVRTILRSSVDQGNFDRYIGTGRVNALTALQKTAKVVAHLDSSLDYKSAQGSLGISGIAEGEHFKKYVVEYGRGIYPDDWIEIESSTLPKNGVLASWDTTKVDEGVYSIRLTVTAGLDEDVIYYDTALVSVDNEINTYYVDDDNTQGPWDGTEDHPFKYVQDAIDMCGNIFKDTIQVKSGTYHEKLTITHTSINLEGEDKETTVIVDTDEYPDVFMMISKSEVSITGFNFTLPYNRSYGIFLDHSSSCIISDNNFNETYTSFSIWLQGSSNNVISGNTIWTDSSRADIALTFRSNNNKISDNTCHDITIYGEGNIVSGNTITVVHRVGIDLFLGSNNKICDNIISNPEFGHTTIGISIEGSRFNTITNNTISNYDTGIELCSGRGLVSRKARNNVISNNNISNNNIGINMLGGDVIKNTISGNTISYNSEYGILNEMFKGYASENNKIYYNNFIDNGQNARDEGDNTWYKFKLFGKSMGNYWDDYEERYPNAGNDGTVWDIPYDIPDGNNQDKYPLINQFSGSQSTPQSTPQSNPQSIVPMVKPKVRALHQAPHKAVQATAR